MGPGDSPGISAQVCSMELSQWDAGTCSHVRHPHWGWIMVGMDQYPPGYLRYVF